MFVWAICMIYFLSWVGLNDFIQASDDAQLIKKSVSRACAVCPCGWKQTGFGFHYK